MPKFKFDNCTSKQFIRETGWIPEAKERLQRVAAKSRSLKYKTVRRLRYLTFCAEGAIDVLALRNAKIIKQSKDHGYDTVVFFDFLPQDVGRTLSLIEGANGFPGDFFHLVNLQLDDGPNGDFVDGMPRHIQEGTAVFKKENDIALFTAFRRSFPFDLINLDVERYVIRESEELPGLLLRAWDKLLEWQKTPRLYEKANYQLNEFTLFFTTKIGPRNLPEPHKSGLINVLQGNVNQFSVLGDLLKDRFQIDTARALYDADFDQFLKLAVPKALVSRALHHDWILDPDLSYRGFEFDRSPPNSESYTMVHYILHFKRCEPSLAAQINVQNMPAEIQAAYGASVERIFSTSCEDVDVVKIPMEAELKQSLADLGVANTS